MTSKERMMLALNREKPDRLPITIHQWQPYHLKTYMGGVTALEAFRETGLDAALTYQEPIGTFKSVDPDEIRRYSTPQWQCSMEMESQDDECTVWKYFIQTPDGTLSYKTRVDAKITSIVEYMIKRDEDVELIEKYMPITTPNLSAIERMYEALGDDGILRGVLWGDEGGAWQHASCLMEPTELIMATFDRPDWVHRLLRALTDKKLAYIERMKGAKLDLIETGGGAASSTLISPEIHAEYCTPYDRELHDALHSLGFMITYHTCGGTKGIEELIVANGTDVSETMAPPSVGGNQEPWEFKEKIAGRLGLIGGIDQFNTLTSGSKSKVRDTVRTLFEKVGDQGGYICSASDHFFEVPKENLMVMAKTAKECVY